MSPKVPNCCEPAKGASWSEGRMALLLTILVVGVYANSFFGVMMFDDHKNIRDREAIHTLWPVTPLLVETRRPTLMLSLAVNYAVSGLNPWSYHLVNLAAHAIAALICFDLVRRLIGLGDKSWQGEQRAAWLAFAIASLWAIHPLQTQAVTYIIQRSESIMGLCYLLAAYSLVRGSQSRRPHFWYVVSIASFAIGLGMKSVIITAPVVLLLLDRSYLATDWPTVFKQRGYVYAMMGTLAVAMIWSMRTAIDPQAKSSFGLGAGVSSWEYLRTQPEILLHYVRLAFWPSDLCLDYRWPVQDSLTVSLGLGALVVAGVAASMIMAVKHPRIGFPPLAALLVLAPTSSVVPIIDLAFEHRMYLPLLGLVALVVLAVNRGVTYLFRDSRHQDVVLRVFIGLTLVALGARTIVRNTDYRSEVRMWTSVCRIAPANARAHFNLAIALADRKQIRTAISEYEIAIRLQPGYAKAHYNLAMIHASEGDVDQAIHQYQQALTAKPTYQEALYNLALIYQKQEQFADAERCLHAALEIDPQYRDASYNLAILYGETRRWDRAIEQYERTIQIDDRDQNAMFNLASLYFKLGKTVSAIDYYQKTLAINPLHHNARMILATALAESEQMDAAIALYSSAIRGRPHDVALLDQFGLFLARQKQFDDAKVQFEAALAIQPRYVAALAHLGMAHRQLGEIPQAIAKLESAVELQPNLVHAGSELAFLLATASEASQRDGKQSLRLAKRLDHRTNGNDVRVLEALAAAYAETGDFTKAVSTAQSATKLARARDRQDVVARLKRQLECYHAGKPFHVPTPELTSHDQDTADHGRS